MFKLKTYHILIIKYYNLNFKLSSNIKNLKHKTFFKNLKYLNKSKNEIYA